MTKKNDWRAELAAVAEKLRDPFRMRMAVAGVTLVVMFFAISEPLHGRIKRCNKNLDQLRTTAKTAEEVVLLRTHLEAIEPRILRGDSSDVVTSHLIELVRQQSVDLLRIDAESPTRLGPIESVRVSLDATGSFSALSQLLNRIENDQYLVRVETIAINPPERNRSTPTIQLSIRMMRDKS